VCGVIVLDTNRKARQWRAFAIRCPVSGLPNSLNAKPTRGKSPDTTANIPVFRRPTAETEFDQHWLAGLTVQIAKTFRPCRREMGILSLTARRSPATRPIRVPVPTVDRLDIFLLLHLRALTESARSKCSPRDEGFIRLWTHEACVRPLLASVWPAAARPCNQARNANPSPGPPPA
jgi:hypothetical protein